MVCYTYKCVLLLPSYMLYVLVPVLLVFFNTSRRVVMWKKKPQKKNYMHASMRFELGPFSIAHAPLYRYTNIS